MPKRIPTYRPPFAPKTEKERHQRFKRERTDDNGFYSRKPWRDLRAQVLAAEPLCRMCQREGITTVATHVDHILDRRDRPELEYDFDNLQPLCVHHHNSKTASTVNGRRYGNA